MLPVEKDYKTRRYNCCRNLFSCSIQYRSHDSITVQTHFVSWSCFHNKFFNLIYSIMEKITILCQFQYYIYGKSFHQIVKNCLKLNLFSLRFHQLENLLSRGVRKFEINSYQFWKEKSLSHYEFRNVRPANCWFGQHPENQTTHIHVVGFRELFLDLK